MRGIGNKVRIKWTDQKRLTDAIKGRRNNFDFIRFVAASFVIISHSFALSGRYTEPLLGPLKLGTLGVYIFFSISGFLVMQSWQRHPRVAAFIGKRLIRIMPGLVGALLFVLLIVGPIFSSLPLRQYLHHPLTLEYLNNISLYSLSFSLPNVFTNNPWSDSTNGSLWTLAYEFSMYVLLALAGLIALTRPKLRLPIILIGVLGIACGLIIGTRWPVTLFHLKIDWLSRFGGFFVAGALFYYYRRLVVLSDGLALACFGIFVLSLNAPFHTLIQMILLPYIVLYLSFMKSPLLANFGRFGDFSYGMYIYAWPVQQIFASGHISPLRLILYAYPVIILLAAISWHLIEKPCLRLKYRFSTDFYPIHVSPTPKATISDKIAA